MRYLNLGCGKHYSIQQEWVNVDFISAGEGVIAHNLLNGIPFASNSFDLVYHSHVLEHFSKIDGEKMIAECFRVLKPGGVLRIAIPNLEVIVKKYIQLLDDGIKNPQDEIIRMNYDWILLEMYDQTLRNYSGGRMAEYLFQDTVKNEDFVYERLGSEVRSLRANYLESKINSSGNSGKENENKVDKLVSRLRQGFKRRLFNLLKIDPQALAIGKFRLGGEIHQWMYDRYSLSNLLASNGGKNIQIQNAFSSKIANWSTYNLDGKDGVVRKPDSLFIEATF